MGQPGDDQISDWVLGFNRCPCGGQTFVCMNLEAIGNEVRVACRNCDTFVTRTVVELMEAEAERQALKRKRRDDGNGNNLP